MSPPQLSREWNEFAATNPTYINHDQDLETIRRNINQQSLDNMALLKEPAMAALASVKAVDATITLPHAPTHKFRIRVYSPGKSSAKTLPVMLYFHNGYWATGNVDGDDLGCRAMIGHGNELVIISFEYRLAPENSWDTILSDAEYALQWVNKDASTYGGDVRKGLYIGGATAGAHLAAATAIRGRDRHPSIQLAGQCLIVPTVLVYSGPQSVPSEWAQKVVSHQENAEAPVFGEKDWQKYLSILNVPESEQKKGENFPVWADLKGLPPTYLAMDGPDPIRDEGYLYEAMLRKAGVQTRTDHYELPNWFVQFPQLPTTAKAGMELATAVRWLLEGNKYTL
ncbi:Abhydrolase_3 domain-containing protein [Trichoderma simmonsii]|uniref:Abhydrolase_3 domain-containing protein n=1 Tax=Trichoderma simmonsii TaxID=1491479 RepID=A0A8G0LTJ7_9HYPO|nr:Abhydrolase_3 domain-containing protein [Trichoderma simmonsii]